MECCGRNINSRRPTLTGPITDSWNSLISSRTFFWALLAYVVWNSPTLFAGTVGFFLGCGWMYLVLSDGMAILIRTLVDSFSNVNSRVISDVVRIGVDILRSLVPTHTRQPQCFTDLNARNWNPFDATQGGCPMNGFMANPFECGIPTDIPTGMCPFGNLRGTVIFNPQVNPENTNQETTQPESSTNQTETEVQTETPETATPTENVVSVESNLETSESSTETTNETPCEQNETSEVIHISDSEEDEDWDDTMRRAGVQNN